MSPTSTDEIRIVICTPIQENYNEPEQGAIKPIVEETTTGLVPVDPSTFENTGKIHVTKGYHKLFSTYEEGQLYKVKASISSSWNSGDAHDGISKYVTYERNVEPTKYLEISMLFEAEYPDPSQPTGTTCITNIKPTDGFFLKCLNPEGKQVIVGPLDVIKDSLRNNQDSYSFKYKGPDKPFGGEWSRLNKVPHSTLIFEIDLISNGIMITSHDQDYIINTEQLPFLSSHLLDLSSDDNLLKWASKLLRISGSTSSVQLSSLKELIAKIPNDIELPDTIIQSRKTRLRELPDRLSTMDGFGQIISDYMGTEEGITTVKQYVEANRNSLLVKYFDDELESIQKKAEYKTDKILADKTKQLHLIKTQITELENKREEFNSSTIGSELGEIQTEIKSLRAEKEIILEISEMETHKKLLRREIAQLGGDQEKAKLLLEEIQANINQSQESHKLKLIELKMGLEAISGNVQPKEALKAKIKIDGEFTIVSGNTPDEEKYDIIKNLLEKLQSRGRIINEDEVAVLLTCIMQNLIVTLAGKPGSGKSSTISELSNILGIRQNGKYVHLQVQRGWSSDRDLLGFYNKLNHSYEPDRFGLYKLIKGLQDIRYEQQLSLVLLDEANLSPIEHYWSGFMGACDDKDGFSTQGDRLSLPEGLRFIATVNYDRTTEPLSARFLDRSPVIYLENKISSSLSESYDNIKYSDDSFNYSFHDLTRLFGKIEHPEFTADESRILDEIIDEHRFLQIKHRKIKAILHFTETLRPIMNEAEMLKAFDYAVLIHLIPLISGQGRDYSHAVNNFYDYLTQQSLTLSSNRLKEIIDNSQFDAYSYFS